MSEVLSKPEVAKIYIDSRGPRFGAAITTVVLAIALVTKNPWVLALQGTCFAIGALRGPQFTPYGLIFKEFVKPRLRADGPTEDVRPPKFAQRVGQRELGNRKLVEHLLPLGRVFARPDRAHAQQGRVGRRTDGLRIVRKRRQPDQLVMIWRTLGVADREPLGVGVEACGHGKISAGWAAARRGGTVAGRGNSFAGSLILAPAP